MAARPPGARSAQRRGASSPSRSPSPSSATPWPRRRTRCGGAAPARRRASWCRCCSRWRSIGVAWSRTRGLVIGLAIAALVFTAAVTLILVGVDDGRLARQPDGGRRLDRWVSPAVDLRRARGSTERRRRHGARRRAGGRGGPGGCQCRCRPLHVRGRAVAGLIIGVAGTAAVGVAVSMPAPRSAAAAGGADDARGAAAPDATLVAVRGVAVHRSAPADARPSSWRRVAGRDASCAWTAGAGAGPGISARVASAVDAGAARRPLRPRLAAASTPLPRRRSTSTCDGGGSRGLAARRGHG